MRSMILSALVASVIASAPSLALTAEEAEEVREMQERFAAEVSGPENAPDEGYRRAAVEYAAQKMAEAGVDSPEYFIFVDRHPKKQRLMVAFWDGRGQVTEIGWGLTSTGKLKPKKGYSLTPTGTYPVVRLGYRAKGTKNPNGWMGLGVRGARTWGFGEVESLNHKGVRTKIVMQMHATDPYFGEPRLGTPDSKGCIRISNRMNVFLDIYGIMDGYALSRSEEARKRILNPNRQPVRHPGRMLIVAEAESE